MSEETMPSQECEPGNGGPVRTAVASPTVDGLVVVPVYNGAAGLQRVVDSLSGAVPGATVLFVDDGSTDGSTRVLAQAGVRYVRHPVNLGDEEALRTGMTFALLEGGAREARADSGDE